jgi:glycosyltransferase involved in cell wall biosynthesis/SAM-dependent methyltransferase
MINEAIGMMTTERRISDDSLDNSAGRPTVAVIIPVFNHAHFLAEALKSVLNQIRSADEIIVIDDGSTDHPEAVIARFQNVQLIRQENCGLAAARNTGLRACTTSHVVFLDADDMLLPEALEAGLACFAHHPGCAFVYGGHRCISGNGQHLYDLFRAIDGDAHLAMLRRNEVCMIAAVLFRRDFLLAAGGFDESLRRCEDVDVYLRMTQNYSIAGYSTIVAQYRKHSENMSNDSVAQLKTMLGVLDRHEARIVVTPAIRAALREGRGEVRELYAARMINSAAARWRAHHDIGLLAADLAQAARSSLAATCRLLVKLVGRRVARALPAPVVRWIQWIRGRPFQIPVGSVRFGDLKRPSPIGHGFGYDRGLPIDRYYIENFLANHAGDIRGRVLEIGDNSYTLRFGGAQVSRSDILHVDCSNVRATFVGDLAHPETLPAEVFDCIVLTQTLHLVFDMHAALKSLYRALKPGGVLLVTVPGITRIDSGEWGPTWYWSLTAAATRRLLGTFFDTDSVTVDTYGNVLAATAFLYALATEELGTADLEVNDPIYPVIVTARAIKRTSS